MLVALGIAAQIAIVAHAPDSVVACDAIDLSVAISAPANVIPRLEVPTFAPFDVLRASPRVEYSPTGTISEYRFTIATGSVGRFTIPSFVAVAGDARVASRPVTVLVAPARGRLAPEVIARARIDTSADVNLRSAGTADTVFVGQQATYEVAVFLNQAARERLRRNPTFYPPEMQAMLAYDLPASESAPRRRGSQCFDALVYRRALFPLVSGRLVIPPAQLVYSTGYSLLSREESHELETDSVTIVSVDPPLDGRPPEFAGAVGALHVDARVDSASRVGDPMLFTVRVSGVGNVKLFPRPSLALPWAALVEADERVRVDSTTQRVSGVKEFDWVLTPRIAGEFDVPPVKYGVFDPSRRAYQVVQTPPSHVSIARGTLATADTGHVDAPLTIRTSYRGERWPAPQSHPVFWAIMALAPLPAVAMRARRRVGRPRPSQPTDPIAEIALAAADDPVTVRRLFVRALAARLGCGPEEFTRPGALDRALRRAGVSEETSTRAEIMLRALDSASFDVAGTLPRNAPREAGTIARAVDAEALARTELPFWLPALFTVALCTLGVAAMAADNAAVSFSRGVSAYLRQDFADARSAFSDAVNAAPAAPDAWANYGTSAWLLSDTATAVFAWRQGLALEPDAEDLQLRVELPRGIGPASPGWVPELPSHAAVWTFALLWVGAWGIAWYARRPHPWAARAVVPAVVCALLVGVLSIELESRVAGNRLAVVRSASALVSDPAIGMDRGPSVATGEIVRVVGRRGTWTRVEAADDRDGWISSAQLLPLSERHALNDR
ncbi:MAG TPA: hypothetical protein VJ867_02940 [Gemmatimonadaceae bacterium]|nr:hypothetical protein [Gemmatimonadaceae bacterium]